MAAPDCAKTTMWPSAVCAAVMALCLCLACAGPGAKLPPPKAQVERLADLLRLETSREQAAIAHRSLFYREPELEQFLDRVLASLMPAEAPEGIRPRVVLVREPSLDAYSFPDGAIYLHTGLCARLQSEPELALLLAHELVHVTRQHALRALVACPPNVEAPFFRSLLSDSLSWFQVAPAPAAMDSPSEELLNLRRSLEQEADRMGLDMVVQAGYDPYEAIEIFDNLIEIEGGRSGAERAAAILAELSSRGLIRSGNSSDRSAFGKRLQALLLDQGWLELRHGRWDGALRCARRLVRDAPTHAGGHYLLGETLRRRNETGDVARALTHFFQAIASEPSFPQPYKAIGLIHFKQGQIRLAKGFLEKALALAPHSSDNDYIRSYLTQCTLITGGEDL